MQLPDPRFAANINILIAEDEPAVREFISRGLASAGYNITLAEDGEQALAKLAEAEAANLYYDLLITDIVMPHVDGITLALKASRDFPSMKIIMISGYAAERQRAHNLDAMIYQVIAKPFSLAELLSHTADALKPSPL